MSAPLVLSLFPGIGLLDMAFEEEGFCVVRGPDLLWGGDIRRFHLPPRKFEAVIGGTPCQRFSRFVPLILKNGYELAPDMIPEFERCVFEAQPSWWLMENVEHAPLARVEGYEVDAQMYDNRWIGGEQSRRHRFCFGTRNGRRLQYEVSALENPAWSPRVCASGGPVTVRLLAGGKPKRSRAKDWGNKPVSYFKEAVRLQGLPADFDLPPFTVKAKVRALGNAVPLPMGRAVARAVKRAMYGDCFACSGQKRIPYINEEDVGCYAPCPECAA